MPVFDYFCESCRKQFSELVFGSEQVVCPQCASKKIKKLFSPFYTISESTRFETDAKDLPSMDAWRKTKHTSGKISTKKDPLKPVRTMKKTKSVKPRAGVHRKKSH